MYIYIPHIIWVIATIVIALADDPEAALFVLIIGGIGCPILSIMLFEKYEYWFRLFFLSVIIGLTLGAFVLNRAFSFSVL